MGDDDQRGHGTSVAGLAVYGSFVDQLEDGGLTARFNIASAKVVDAEGKFDDDETVPSTIDIAIRRLHAEFGCRVINISLADCKRLVGERPSSWAMVIDNLARELDLVITLSAGNNQIRSARFAADGLGIYPSYMLENEHRLYEPASSVNALVVGSLAHGNGLDDADEEHADIQPLTQLDEPSPFSRCGPGYKNCIKPDIAEYGGTAIWQGFNDSLNANRDSCGILTLAANYTEQLFSFRHGTSFAAPTAAFKAAVIREELPNVTANTVRALMAISADNPKSLLAKTDTADTQGKRNHLNFSGYGITNLADALESEDSRPVLYAEDTLKVDTFAVYEVPIPEDFQTVKGTRHIRVALAFDPLVRKTRKDYIGIKMGFHLVKGESQQDVFDKFRKWEQQDKDDHGDPFNFEGTTWQCKMEPPATTRELGTLQVGTFVAKRDISHYGDRYFLAVRCEGKWAKEIVGEQRFSVAVQLWHEANLELYQSLAVEVQV